MAPGLDQSGEPRGRATVVGVPTVERTLRLSAGPSAPRLARSELRAFLASEDLPPERLYELELLLSELVSNAVEHGSRAGDAVEVMFERRRGDLVVSVTDAGRGASAPQVRPESKAALSGRGLRAVERLSDEWAAETGAGRCAVWFRAGLPPHAASA